MKISDLRQALFATLNDVRAGTLDAKQAKAISDIGQVIVNSAKAEIDFLRLRPNLNGTGFIPEEFTPGTAAKPRLVNGKAHSGSH